MDIILNQVINKFIDRSNKGIKKYGTTLFENNNDDFLKHLQEELMDAVLYIEKYRMLLNPNSNIELSIDSIDLSVRAYNAIQAYFKQFYYEIYRSGVKVKHLIQLTPYDLMKGRAIGQRTLSEIECVLENLGLKLNQNETNATIQID